MNKKVIAKKNRVVPPPFNRRMTQQYLIPPILDADDFLAKLDQSERGYPVENLLNAALNVPKVKLLVELVLLEEYSIENYHFWYSVRLFKDKFSEDRVNSKAHAQHIYKKHVSSESELAVTISDAATVGLRKALFESALEVTSDVFDDSLREVFTLIIKDTLSRNKGKLSDYNKLDEPELKAKITTLFRKQVEAKRRIKLLEEAAKQPIPTAPRRRRFAGKVVGKLVSRFSGNGSK